MTLSYIVYPEAVEKLKSSGLMDKINAVDKLDENFPSTYAHESPNDMIKGMTQAGFFEVQPKEAKKKYQRSLEKFHTNGGTWKIIKNGREIEEAADSQSFMLISGYLASFFLSKQELWTPEKFGFKNIYDLFGSIGAAYVNKDRAKTSERTGHSWKHQLQDGRIFISEVGVNMHGDLEITRDELTPYKTFDPLGNEVNYRPVLQSDINSIMSYHSVEDGLLATLLTYIRQEKIESLFTNKELASKFLEELEISSGRALYADFGDRIHPPSIFFDRRISMLKWEDRDKPHTGHYLPCGGSGSYGIFVDVNKNLIFAYIGEKDNGFKEGNRKADFEPSEIDHLVKGLFIQAARQLGRTSITQLVNVLRYWHGENVDFI